jgi:signal transduction histidine kinase
MGDAHIEKLKRLNAASSQGRRGNARRETQRELREALLELSHDVRHSVGTILTLVDASRHDIDADSATVEYLDGIECEASSIAALCRHVLAGEQTHCSVRVDDLAQRIVHAATSDFGGEIELALAPVSLTCDEIALTRLIRNLTQNACRAAGARGWVRVSVRCVARTILIEVADSGPGFGHVSREGGLGLAIVQSAVEALHATLTVAERQRRTSIVVSIPVEQPAGAVRTT